MKKYHIITFGCQMNEHDSENVAGMLEGMGYEFSEDPYKADVVVLNTCTLIKGFTGCSDNSKKGVTRIKTLESCVFAAVCRSSHVFRKRLRRVLLG